MKFTERQFSKRFPPIECAVFVMHEPALSSPMLVISPEYRATGAAIILPYGAVYVGVSVCSPEDQFIKATGRSKALGRAFQAMRKSTAPYRVPLDSNYANPIPLIKSYIEKSIATKKDGMGLL